MFLQRKNNLWMPRCTDLSWSRPLYGQASHLAFLMCPFWTAINTFSTHGRKVFLGHMFWISFFQVYPDLSLQLIHCLAAPSQAMPHGFVFPIPVQPRRAVPKMDISGVGPMRAWPTSEQTAVTSCRPWPPPDDPPSSPQTSVCFQIRDKDIFF